MARANTTAKIEKRAVGIGESFIWSELLIAVFALVSFAEKIYFKRCPDAP
jgi:hypothetical protein